ncbi:MAG: hypothetical protein IT276_14900 [Ignavibacteriaceae bacterium]|nr:hypothetical protein [Ignavibacteriaceae bacterium]
MAIEFTENNKPICDPQDYNDCALNSAALVDVWNALKCISEQKFNIGSKCFYFPAVVNQDVFLINKSELVGLPANCEITFEWNGVKSYSNGTFADDPRNYTLTEEATAYKFTLNSPVGDAENPCDVAIKVDQLKLGLDIINGCEPESCS